MTERKIIIGLIVSSDYLRSIRAFWDIQLIESATAKYLANWAWEYFEKYDKAPLRNIESIFYEKIRSSKISKQIAEEIESEILPGLSEEYEQESFNVDYAVTQTKKYFRERRLAIFADQIQGLLATGQPDEAEKLASDYKPIPEGSDTELDLSNPVVLDRIDKAFEESSNPIITFPRQLGEFWNEQFYRGSFIALQASEKRGKTWNLMQIALTAHKQNNRVVFFQAGDMSEGQMLIRIAINLTGKSNKAKYSGEMYEPVRDCVFNQMGTCKKSECECNFGIFVGYTEEFIKNEIMQNDLIEAYENNPDYKPCYNCSEYWTKPWGVPYLKKINTGEPLTKKEAKKAVNDFFIKNKRSFKLSTHSNGSLSVRQMRAILGIWEKQENFVPDVIVLDYADLLIADARLEFRHQQNQIWKDLRGLSQDYKICLVTATQADADSYSANLLTQKNFSEDKRKYAHATAFYGLNQDPKGREKKIGLMRINQILLREGDFSNNNQVTILQNIKRGRPMLASYF